MKNFYVEWETPEGDIEEKTIEADSPGNAFYKVLKKNPGAKLRRCVIEGHLAGRFGKVWIEYDPPSTASVEPLPKENLEQTLMPFMDQ